LQTKSLCHVVSFMLSGVISEPIDYLLAVTPTNSLVLSGELQEEIMWIAEAARMPVIWATQVLENVAKTGQPSRAEITDAAVAERQNVSCSTKALTSSRRWRCWMTR